MVKLRMSRCFKKAILLQPAYTVPVSASILHTDSIFVQQAQHVHTSGVYILRCCDMVYMKYPKISRNALFLIMAKWNLPQRMASIQDAGCLFVQQAQRTHAVLLIVLPRPYLEVHAALQYCTSRGGGWDEQQQHRLDTHTDLKTSK